MTRYTRYKKLDHNAKITQNSLDVRIQRNLGSIIRSGLTKVGGFMERLAMNNFPLMSPSAPPSQLIDL